jgi:hypothetical protein
VFSEFGANKGATASAGSLAKEEAVCARGGRCQPERRLLALANDLFGPGMEANNHNDGSSTLRSDKQIKESFTSVRYRRFRQKMLNLFMEKSSSHT